MEESKPVVRLDQPGNSLMVAEYRKKEYSDYSKPMELVNVSETKTLLKKEGKREEKRAGMKSAPGTEKSH